MKMGMKEDMELEKVKRRQFKKRKGGVEVMQEEKGGGKGEGKEARSLDWKKAK